MHETAAASSSPSPTFLAAFRRKAGHADRLRFDQFMDLALYEPGIGYYASNRLRVGRNTKADFYTSVSSGPLFGELIAAATSHLVRAFGAEAPSAYSFVEIGAEPGSSVLEGGKHPFASLRTLRLGQKLEFSGPSIVFSNELFDAQPCRRFIRRNSAWIELGVAEQNGKLEEVDIGKADEAWLPAEAAEGYRFDAPRAAAELCADIANQPWHGLFLALDYGKSEPELFFETPGGTIRAYHQHKQTNEVLERPGEQDLTCHICWDWLAEALGKAHFTGQQILSQEAFFVKNASDILAAITATEAGRFSPRKQSLLQLLHPSHMGSKFQALYAWRPAC